MISVPTIVARAGQLAGRAAMAAAALSFLLLAVGPHTGRYRVLTVLTASMRPAFGPGAAVVVVPVAVSDLAVGDVITYAAPTGDHAVVTHRVIEVLEPGTIRTKGDASNAADPWVARLRGDTVWQVRAQVPLLGQAIQLMRQPAIRVASVLGGALMAVVLGLRRIWETPQHA